VALVGNLRKQFCGAILSSPAILHSVALDMPGILESVQTAGASQSTVDNLANKRKSAGLSPRIML